MQNNQSSLVFDERGYLQPISPIVVELHGEPLQALAEWSQKQPFMNEHRQEIWRQFLLYNKHLIDIIGDFAEKGIEQWLNGSFTTLKKQPNDLDLVTFIRKDIAILHGNEIQVLKEKMEIILIDDYIVETVEKSEKGYIIYQSDRAYWYDLFTKTKRNLRTDRQYHKGFLHFKYFTP
jgi:hypothetical protein